MKIYYRDCGETVKIVRCFGTDSHVVLPDRINGKPVTAAAAYAFSARKDKEEEDAAVYETEDHRMFGSGERLLAGDWIESIVFPETMAEIGNYIFYGCRSLKELEFSDNLTGIGSGAFTGCRSLAGLRVHLTHGRQSCVREILGDLWQRIDVEFLDHTGNLDAGETDTEKLNIGERETAGGKTVSLSRLVFPEHYEEAVENTPARILFTQHHGSGNNYRQCFYNKEADYRKYDELFSVARVYDKTPVLTDIAFSRLCCPVGLTDAACGEYERYIRENAAAVAEYLIETEDSERLTEMGKRNLWEEQSLDGAVGYAARRGKRELLSRLMEEKHRRFPAKRKKFEL